MQAARGIDDQHVAVACIGSLHGIENYGARIGPLLMRNDWNFQALAPDLELVDSGGAEGVSRGQHDRAAETQMIGGEFGDRSRLANAIYAHNHDDVGYPALKDLHLPIAGCLFEQLDHIPAQKFPWDNRDRRCVLQATLRRMLPTKRLRHIPTDIGLDEQHLQIFIKFLIDRFAIEKATIANALARLSERLFHLRIWFGAPLEESVEDHGVSPEYNGGRMDRHRVDRRGNRVVSNADRSK